MDSASSHPARFARGVSRVRAGSVPFPADAKHAQLDEHSRSAFVSLERTMAALNVTANMVVAVKAQRVGGVRRVAAKHAVARVGGLKAPVSVSMRKGTCERTRARRIFPQFRAAWHRAQRASGAGSVARRSCCRARASPENLKRLGLPSRIPQSLTSSVPVLLPTSAGGRQSLGVFAAGLDFAELESAVEDEEMEWSPRWCVPGAFVARLSEIAREPKPRTSKSVDKK